MSCDIFIIYYHERKIRSYRYKLIGDPWDIKKVSLRVHMPMKIYQTLA